MRAVLYGVSVAVMLLASLGMALLPRLAPGLLVFVAAGAFLSGAISSAWVAVGATAGNWYRPRTGQVLIGTGLLAALFNLWGAEWLAAGWSLLVLLAGLAFAVPIFPTQTKPPERSTTVRPPLGRRESL